MSTGALAGIRVCDLSGQLTGAGATRYLVAFGAEVVRVEDPVTKGSWDIVRGAPPYVDERRGIELGGCFNNSNLGKLGVTLNLRTDRGRELLSELVAVSDVVTENFAAGSSPGWDSPTSACASCVPTSSTSRIAASATPAPTVNSAPGDRSCRRARVSPSRLPCRGRSRPAGATPTWTTWAPITWPWPCWRRSSTGSGPARASGSTCRAPRRP